MPRLWPCPARPGTTSLIYFFFDIDGTLLLSGGAGRMAMQHVFVEMYGIRELPQLAVHGRTDRAIILELFERLQLDGGPEAYEEFTSRYHRELAVSMDRCPGRLLEGVPELLVRLESWTNG